VQKSSNRQVKKVFMATQDSQVTGARFIEEALLGLQEPNGARAAGEAAVRSTQKSKAVSGAIPHWQGWRRAAERIREYAIAHLDRHLLAFEAAMVERGATVLWAENAQQATSLVVGIAREHNVRRVVKGKSMVSEEIALNDALKANGIEATETDLGEYIVQLADQRPTHIVTPALHLSAEDIGKLFCERLGEAMTADYEALTQIARKRLRDAFLKADMGISGCNFAVADTGSLVIVENEGNVGLSTSTPPIHVALLGIEKVLPSIDYLPLFLQLLARVSTGQKLTTYTHLIRGPTQGSQLYVILLDNGRTKMLQDPVARKALTCIRCGMCLNVCPVYRRVGGWAYGWVYSGPIGSITTPHLIGIEKAGCLAYASSLCGACSEICPVKVDIPTQLVHLRHRSATENQDRFSTERLIWKIWAWAMIGRRRYTLAVWAFRVAIRLARLLPLFLHPRGLLPWTRRRELPLLPRFSFRELWKRRVVR
jgi:L-lactate dehydrogenase complex protein LldF